MADVPWPSKPPMLDHYLIARRTGGGPDLLLLSAESGEEALVAFSSREASEMFIRSRTLEEQWYSRASSAGEMISLLCGPYVGVKWISLNPLPAPIRRGREKSMMISRDAYIDFFLG